LLGENKLAAAACSLWQLSQPLEQCLPKCAFALVAALHFYSEFGCYPAEPTNDGYPTIANFGNSLNPAFFAQYFRSPSGISYMQTFVGDDRHGLTTGHDGLPRFDWDFHSLHLLLPFTEPFACTDSATLEKVMCIKMGAGGRMCDELVTRLEWLELYRKEQAEEEAAAAAAAAQAATAYAIEEAACQVVALEGVSGSDDEDLLPSQTPPPALITPPDPGKGESAPSSNDSLF
jgi:hypothetical protein